MFNTNIEHITEMDLQALIDNSVTELKTLEYKAILPGNPDSERREFLADVSSFANSLGGSIVLGIVCDNSTGIPKTLDGITANNWDQEILKARQHDQGRYQAENQRNKDQIYPLIEWQVRIDCSY